MALTTYGERLRELLADGNVRAFLRVLREGESSQGEAAYFMRWPNKRFDDLSRHPAIREPGPNGPSDAAGAYQFLSSTWREMCAKTGVEYFGVEEQDINALALIDTEGALGDVIAGNLSAAIDKLGGRWASLPSSRHGQPTVKLERLQSVFAQYGGTTRAAAAAQPSAGVAPSPVPPPSPTHTVRMQPPAESAMSLPLALLVPLLAKVVEVLPWFSSGSKSAERNIKVAQEVAPILIEGLKQTVPAAPNVQAQVEAVLADKTLLNQLIANLAPRGADMAMMWEQTAESIDAARDAELAFLSAGYSVWKSPSFWVALLLIPLVYMIVVSMAFTGPYLFDWPSDIRAQTAGTVVGMVIGAIVGYYFGMMTSRNRIK